MKFLSFIFIILLTFPISAEKLKKKRKHHGAWMFKNQNFHEEFGSFYFDTRRKTVYRWYSGFECSFQAGKFKRGQKDSKKGCLLGGIANRRGKKIYLEFERFFTNEFGVRIWELPLLVAGESLPRKEKMILKVCNKNYLCLDEIPLNRGVWKNVTEPVEEN